MQALSIMMVISGSRCDLLQSCCHAPPYRVPSSYEGFKESGPEVGNLLRKWFVTLNPEVKLGKRNQVRIERSRVKCSAQGASGEIQKKESGSRGCGLKPLDILSERIVPLKEGRKGEVGEHFNQPHGGMPGNEISNSEYQKIQNLRFSGDMWEGDSGPQVLDLQRALYWFGYLSKRTELTAYFGPETKRALQLFQIAHKVAGTGAWGSSSRQALWKLLNEESSSFSEGGSGVHIKVQQPGTTTFVNEANVGGPHVGLRVAELMNNMGAHSQEFMSTLSSAPCWRHLPMNVPRNAAMFGLLVGMLVALFGIGYTVVGMMFHDPHGQPVRRRLLRAHWRDDLTGTTTPMKPKRHLDMFPGLDLPAVGEGDSYESYRLRSKSRPTGRTDRLILYEGQVLVGDESHSSVYPFMNGRGSGKTGSQGGPSRARASSILNGEASNEQVSRRPVSNGSVSAPREESFRGSQISSKRTSNERIRESKMFRSERSSSLGGNNAWQDKDEENFKDHVEELRKSVQAAEMKRQAAMRALSKERQRSLELQVKISRQKESAAALEEEVRVLKESHDALLASLRKKYSSSVAARAAAALLYQHWDTNYKEGSPQTLSY